MACSSTCVQTIYNAAIAYCDADYEEAKQAMEMMNSIDLGNGCRPLVCLYKNPQFSPSSIKRTCCVVKNCLFVFCLLTKNTGKDECMGLFMDEAIGITQFVSCGNCGIPATAVQKENWSVRPLHTQPKETRDYLIPLGLTTIEGFNLTKPSIKDELKEFFNYFKNEKRYLNGCGESSRSSASNSTASERSASSGTARSARSALALSAREISLNSSEIPRYSDVEKEPNLKENVDGYQLSDMFQDSAYNSNSASSASSYYPCNSISIPGNRNRVSDTSNSRISSSTNTVQEHPMDSVDYRRTNFSYSEMLENGRLDCWGNGSRSCKSLADSVPVPTSIKKKPSRKLKAQKKLVNLRNCNIVQIGMQPYGMQSNSNSYNGTFSPQNMEEDSDSEWSNEDPPFTKVQESDKQDSAEKTLVPSDSTGDQSGATETFNLDLSSQNDNLKITIEESINSLQQSISTESLSDSELSSQIYQDPFEERSFDPITAADLNKDNPQDLQAVDYSSYPSLTNGSADADARDPLPCPESSASPNQLPNSVPESMEAEEVLTRDQPLSMGSMRQEDIEDAGGRRVPLIVNRDQLGFGRADENRLTSRFSQPGTLPFSYHSLHSNHWSDRQMSFVDVARLTGVYYPPCMESDELD